MNISVSSIVFVLILMKLYGFEGSDPELKLCEDLTIDAAVNADDGNDYVFKGDYYWSLNMDSGISSKFGALIKDRWKGLNGPIDAAFAIDEHINRLSTVFIKDNKWFLYSKDVLKVNGTTDMWPNFPKTKIQCAFDYYNKSIDRQNVPIFFIHNTDNYTKYVIQKIESPGYEVSGKAYRLGKFLYFLGRSEPPNESPQTIADYIDVRAVLTNQRKLILFGNKEFCFANISEVQPKCEKVEGDDVKKYFGCPRPPQPPTTTSSSTTTTRRTTTTMSTTRPTTLPVSASTNNSVTETTINSNSNIESESIRDTEDSTEPIASENTPSLVTSSTQTIKKKTNWTLIILLIVIIGIILMVSLCVIIYALRNQNRLKSSLIWSKEDQLKTSGQSSPFFNNSVNKYELEIKPTETDINAEPALYSQSKSDALESVQNVRPNQSDSNESLGTAMKRSKSSLMESENYEENASSAIEADQLSQPIKSKEEVE